MAAWAKGHFGETCKHLEQYAEQTGKSLEEAMAKFGYEEPEIPEGFEFVWEWFFELSDARGHNGYGWNALTNAEISAWANISGIKMRPWLVKCFRAMDREWMKAQAEEQKKKSKAKKAK